MRDRLIRSLPVAVFAVALSIAQARAACECSLDATGRGFSFASPMTCADSSAFGPRPESGELARALAAAVGAWRRAQTDTTFAADAREGGTALSWDASTGAWTVRDSGGAAIPSGRLQRLADAAHDSIATLYSVVAGRADRPREARALLEHLRTHVAAGGIGADRALALDWSVSECGRARRVAFFRLAPGIGGGERYRVLFGLFADEADARRASRRFTSHATEGAAVVPIAVTDVVLEEALDGH